MVRIPGGTFAMGCTFEQGDDCDDDEFPAHKVTLAGFQMGKYEVTQAQWASVMWGNSSEFDGCSRCPVENVSWNDVQDFIEELNMMTGKGYRLPTEAEWEYAARGGERFKYSGSNNLDRVSWYGDNSGRRTHEVGQKRANGYGLYDMSGNVWEWCSDKYGSDYYGKSPGRNPTGPPKGAWRVVRGGSCYYPPGDCRVANRSGYNSPGDRSSDRGFRLAL